MPGAASNNTLAIFRADQESAFLHTGYHADARCLGHDLIGNRFIWSRHDFVQNIFRALDASIEGCLIVCCIGRHCCKGYSDDAKYCKNVFHLLSILQVGTCVRTVPISLTLAQLLRQKPLRSHFLNWG